MGSNATLTVEATTALVPVKKRKVGTLSGPGMVDYSLSEAQQARADIKLVLVSWSSYRFMVL
jgi:hypothetical protein